MKLNAIEFTRKTGNEIFSGYKNKKTLLDFWQWAYSDLIGNTERGAIAEYIVAIACNIDDNIRVSWDSYDLLLKNGLKIEVKSSAYLQTWKQKKYSTPIFNIPKTKAWDFIENTYDTERKRQADLYVFALLAHLDKETINPLDTNQWEFYIISTININNQLKDSKQISLKRLIEIGAIKSTFERLHENILKTVRDIKIKHERKDNK
jgi:hypothetical protein